MGLIVPRYVRSIDDWPEVERRIKAWGELERGMRTGQSWTPLTEGAIFSRFWRQSLIIQPGEQKPPGGLVLVGVDHGLEEGRQYGSCSVAYKHSEENQEVWALSEYCPEYTTSTLADGEGVVNMILDAGIVRSKDPLTALRAVDIWVGDRPIQKHVADVKKSNRKLAGGIRAYLSQYYGRRVTQKELPPRLRSAWLDGEGGIPKKRAGSPWTSISFLQELMINERTRFSSNVPELIRAVQSWNGNPRAPGKDRIDGWRYPIEKAMRIFGIWRWE